MNRRTARVLLAALAIVPLACGAAAPVPPPNGGTVLIEPKTASGDYDPELHLFVEAVTQALTAKGFTVLEAPMHTAYVLQLTLDRADVGTGYGKSRGDASAAMAGTSVVVPFSTGASKVVTLQRAKLELDLLNRADRARLWDGSAVAVRSTGARNGTDARVAADLSNALMQVYPQQPDETLGIP